MVSFKFKHEIVESFPKVAFGYSGFFLKLKHKIWFLLSNVGGDSFSWIELPYSFVVDPLDECGSLHTAFTLLP